MFQVRTTNTYTQQSKHDTSVELAEVVHEWGGGTLSTASTLHQISTNGDERRT